MTDIEKLRKSKIVPALRRISRWWPFKAEALRKARVSPGIYKCNICKDDFKQKEVQVDHIKPIVPVKQGFTTWDSFIENLFCDTTNLQTLCTLCHKVKTDIEVELRKKYKKRKKKLDNSK